MSGFAIKEARIEDIPEIIGLAKQVWWLTYESIIGKDQCDYMFEVTYSAEALEEQMAIFKHHFYLLQNEGKAVGFASYSKLENNLFKLHKIYVAGSNQGKGGGRFLLNFIENCVREEGGSRLLLNVNRQNNARSFYEAMGYVIERKEDSPIGSYWMNDYVMSKHLEPEKDSPK